MLGHIRFLYFLLISTLLTACANDIQHLHKAAETGNLRTIQTLLATRIDLNTQNNKGQTPLLLSILNGHPQVALALLNANANPNIADKQGRTPLMVAATLHRTEIIRLLIDKGSDIQAKDHDGDTACDYANLSQLRDIAYTQTLHLLKLPPTDSLFTHKSSY